MRFGVLGTGMVGKAIAGKLAAIGHEVRMGARKADGPEAREWVAKAGPNASQGTFADAAAFGEIVFNCTKGSASVDALKSSAAGALDGKVIVDVANPLDFSKGGPALWTAPGDSLAEQIQRAFPAARVVKTLNTVNCELMVNPRSLPGHHSAFVAGNDADAKARVTSLLKEGFGWPDVVDLGDITAARTLEPYVLLWLRLYGALGTAHFNVGLVR